MDGALRELVNNCTVITRGRAVVSAGTRATNTPHPSLIELHSEEFIYVDRDRGSSGLTRKLVGGLANNNLMVYEALRRRPIRFRSVFGV